MRTATAGPACAPTRRFETPRFGSCGSSKTGAPIVRDADIDSLDAALGELRSLYGWPAPEDPDGSRDEELAGRELIAERRGDEVDWLRDCARWLAQLELGEYPPVINLRPEADHPERCNIVVDIGRVRRVLLRIAADVDELARARSVEELEATRWAPREVVLPGVSELTDDRLYSAMDFLVECSERVQEAVFFSVANLLN